MMTGVILAISAPPATAPPNHDRRLSYVPSRSDSADSLDRFTVMPVPITSGRSRPQAEFQATNAAAGIS